LKSPKYSEQEEVPTSDRASNEATAEELQRQLASLFPEANVAQKTLAELKELDTSLLDDSSTRNDLIVHSGEHALTAVVRSASLGPVYGFTMTMTRQYDIHEHRFARFYTRVFNDDLKTAPLWGPHEELWLSLQQTRHSRTIGRFSPFHTPTFVKWLRTFENAQSLRYEGSQFSIRLVLTKQVEWIRNNEAADFVKFPKEMTLAAALFEEKWTRALAAEGDVALVGLGHDRGIIGVMCPNSQPSSSSTITAPHSDLSGLCNALVKGTMAFVASTKGDLHIIFPNGATFVKSQGQWALFNLRSLERALLDNLPANVARSVARLTFDLSYEGRGALFCFLEDAFKIGEVVPDHLVKDRSNRPLRLTSRKLDINQMGHRKILKRVATIDGAIVFDFMGRVLDSACMISDPSVAALSSAGQTAKVRFPGARSTAAWNASIYGLSVKVSEDGPITVYRKGQRILQTS
jgi:hypothetical protein